ncbi:hypothetical protein GLIP_3632 [Aliiglaciecola lipolytica E3]|uniref:Uncharacterized protein n=1 Tax=Aliiglaciecola lipolytica E3 TaxID=1127673 RepID=K6YHZ4_9ALTE|nr:hypothetical protein GLIP_3632 [Aliiglaciecola lipolytica E3]
MTFLTVIKDYRPCFFCHFEFNKSPSIVRLPIKIIQHTQAQKEQLIEHIKTTRLILFVFI